MYGTMRICEMSPIFMNKLGLQFQDAQNFARFLVEEADERADQDPDKEQKIIYDPNRKADMHIVTVRLQLFTPYAKIFTKDEEENAKIKFEEAFKEKKSKLCVHLSKILKEKDMVLITYDIFVKAIEIVLETKLKLSETEIECGYIILCRPCPYDDIKFLIEKDLARSVKGFEISKLSSIFKDFQLPNIDSNDSGEILKDNNEELVED